MENDRGEAVRSGQGLFKVRSMSSIRLAAVVCAIAMAGCNSSKPFISLGTRATTAPVVAETPTTQPVATSELGTVSNIPGLAPKPKPFIAIPKPLQIAGGRPSTLLLEHASPDSPVPLSDYAKQPEHSIGEFHLRTELSAQTVQRWLGPPAQLADNEDPWLVYRLRGNQEIWLHFTGPLQDQLDAADVIRGAEDGYVRTRVFSADDAK